MLVWNNNSGNLTLKLKLKKMNFMLIENIEI